MPENRVVLEPEFVRMLEQLTLRTRRLFTGSLQGDKRSPRHGHSVELADFRDYVPGDDPRHVDWNAYGRLDRLLVKLFVEEEDLNVHLLVDCSQSMAFGEPSKLSWAQQLAAALGYIALTRLDRVTLASFADSLGPVAGPLRGRAHAPRLLGGIETWEAGGATAFARAARSHAQTVRRPGLLVVVSDFLDPAGYEDGLRLLLGAKHELVVVHVLSPAELAPPWTGDLKLVDSETGTEREVSMGRGALRAYEQSLREFLEGIETFCSGRRVTYLRATSEESIEDAVHRLRRLGVVR